MYLKLISCSLRKTGATINNKRCCIVNCIASTKDEDEDVYRMVYFVSGCCRDRRQRGFRGGQERCLVFVYFNFKKQNLIEFLLR